MQVQTANQKLLQTELQTLVETVEISPQQLTALRNGQIGSREGLESIESALLLLYKAMITIDPNIRSTNGSRSTEPSRFGGDELADMRALQEKRDGYLTESSMFLDRLKQYMENNFGRVLMDTEDGIRRRSGSTRLDMGEHDLARQSLWKYSPLMLFTKEVDLISWDSLIRMYQLRARNVYQAEFTNNFEAWKRMTRKPTGDETELLWTSADKESSDGIGTTARKLTVKRSQTLARTLRNAAGDKSGLNDNAQIGRLYPFEAFAGALEEMAPLVFTEQNFIVDFFHATSTENIDFSDAVLFAAPDARRGTNLMSRKAVEPDRAMAQRVRDIMDELLGFWPSELNAFIQWATTTWGSGDPLQGIGIMQALDRSMLSFEDTNQEYLIRTLQKMHQGLASQFNRVLEEQLRKIEDTKVKIKKRKGVIDFIRIFPAFSAAVENMLAPASEAERNGYGGSSERTDTRTVVDEAYHRINKQMFDSLKVIAKESPGINTQGQQPIGILANADPEDKETLNYHILLIENMNHYLEEVEDHGDPILIEWKGKAKDEMEEHLGLYVDSVVRRPLGKLLVSSDSFFSIFYHSLHPNAAIRTSSTPPPRSSRSRLPSHLELPPAHPCTAKRRCASSSPLTTRRTCGAAPTPCASVWRSTLARAMIRVCAATSSRRCSRGARTATSTLRSARSAREGRCSRARKRCKDWAGERGMLGPLSSDETVTEVVRCRYFSNHERYFGILEEILTSWTRAFPMFTLAYDYSLIRSGRRRSIFERSVSGIWIYPFQQICRYIL